VTLGKKVTLPDFILGQFSKGYGEGFNDCKQSLTDAIELLQRVYGEKCAVPLDEVKSTINKISYK
jgi:hypothetical protein